MPEPTAHKYVQVKISQLENEIKRHRAAIKELNARKQGYESQLAQKPAVVPTPTLPQA